MYKFLSGFFFISGVLLASLDVGNSVFPDAVLLVSIVLSAFCLLLSAYNEYKFSFSSVIVVALVLRFLIMLWNVYGRDIYCLPGVGTDTEGFYRWAKAISKDISLLKGYVYGGYYTKFLGLVFYLTRPSYLLGSYLNYLYGAISISLLYKIIRTIEFLDRKTMCAAMIIYALLPNSMVICSSLRRECLIILFLMASAYCIVKWARSLRMMYALAALFFVLGGSLLHAGTIGLMAGYVVLLLFYNPRLARWQITRQNIIAGIIISAGAFVILTRYRMPILNELLFKDQNDLFRKANRAVGGAAYLTNLRITSVRDIIIYSPLKLFYFLCSPVPWSWRGVSDAIAFFLDAVFFIYLAKDVVRSLFLMKKYPLAFSFGVSCISSLVLFSTGSQNSANAMRHRLKMLGLMIVVMCMVRAYNNRKRRY